MYLGVIARLLGNAKFTCAEMKHHDWKIERDSMQWRLHGTMPLK
jgi:hypothetical protein